MRHIFSFFIFLISSLSVAQEITDTFAWFSGSRPIDACFVVDNQEEKQTFKSILNLAISEWSYKVADFNTLVANGPKLPWKINLKDVCDGNESLTFLMKERDHRINVHYQKYRNPMAFAQLESYDENVGWGKGFIWLSPDLWNYPREKRWNENAIYPLVLHELGHVFGNGHIEGTVMRSTIYRELLNLTVFKKYTGDWWDVLHSFKKIDDVSWYKPTFLKRKLFISDNSFSNGFCSVFEEQEPVRQLYTKLTGLKNIERLSIAVLKKSDPNTWEIRFSENRPVCPWDFRFEEADRWTRIKTFGQISRRCGIEGSDLKIDRVISEQPVGDKNIFIRRLGGKTYEFQATNKLESGFIEGHQGKMQVMLWQDVYGHMKIRFFDSDFDHIFEFTNEKVFVISPGNRVMFYTERRIPDLKYTYRCTQGSAK